MSDSESPATDPTFITSLSDSDGSLGDNVDPIHSLLTSTSTIARNIPNLVANTL